MIDTKKMENRLIERFVRYAKIWTTSDLHGEGTPSTKCQWDLIDLLKKELKDLGVEDVYSDDHGYIIARIPARLTEGKDVKGIGFMAHVDTAPDVSGKDVKPQIHDNYDGGDIKLTDELVLTTSESPELLHYKGQKIITTDGTTLLGGDDKAGLTEIMTALEWLVENPSVPHGPLELIFTPDEEIGKGMDLFPVSKLQSSFCYTVDGGTEGELEDECYNAYASEISFEGISIHPGSARGKFVNAALMASTFATMLPRSESPEATDERFGNYWVHEISGEVEKAKILIYMRDFDFNQIQRRVASLEAFAKAVEAQFPGGKVVVNSFKQYLNMKPEIDKHPEIVKNLIAAVKKTGLEPYFNPIRGGTDGSRLTEMGIPTPNIFTGVHNMHSRKEWIGVSTMVKTTETILNLIEAFVG